MSRPSCLHELLEVFQKQITSGKKVTNNTEAFEDAKGCNVKRCSFNFYDRSCAVFPKLQFVDVCSCRSAASGLFDMFISRSLVDQMLCFALGIYVNVFTNSRLMFFLCQRQMIVQGKTHSSCINKCGIYIPYFDKDYEDVIPHSLWGALQDTKGMQITNCPLKSLPNIWHLGLIKGGR